MKQKLPLPLMILVTVVVIVLVGAASFYVGTKYSSAKRFGAFGNGNFGQGQQSGDAAMAGRRVNALGGGMINGDVLSLDEKSLTVKGRDGSSKMVFFATSTEVGRFAAGTVSDLAVGQNIVVTGKTNSDGSVVAQSIQIRPAAANPDPGTPNAPANPVK
ncbi:MAG: hypothetical protein WC668_01820 [Patescibacteria group bacterium]|jgi:hypothetical protein